MTWTYGGDPAALPRDEVRWRVGDIDKDEQLTSDEEIAFALTQSGADPVEAAALVAVHLSSVFAGRAEIEQYGRRREEYGDRSAKYAALAIEIRSAGGSDAAGVRAPQITVAGREEALSSTTRTPTQFQIGSMRNT